MKLAVLLETNENLATFAQVVLNYVQEGYTHVAGEQYGTGMPAVILSTDPLTLTKDEVAQVCKYQGTLVLEDQSYEVEVSHVDLAVIEA